MKIWHGLFLLILTMFLAPGEAGAFDPAAHFTKSCSSCHTIGQGDTIGPDLKGVTERRKWDWLLHFVISPAAAIQENDPTAKELVSKYKMVMPDQDLKKDEIGALLDYIEKGGVSEAPVDSRPVASASEAETRLGEDLFLGRVRFANGAPACISCHSAGDAGALGGGTFAIDLTQVFSRYDEKILTQALKNPGFRVMNVIFADKPLTEEEVFAVKSYLYKVDQSEVLPGDTQKKFIFLGVGGCVVLLGVTDLVWRRRRRKSAKPRA